MQKPELLAPAKNLERLKVAIQYGADAVYIGGQKYGLRARADNFTPYQVEKAVAFAHARNAKVYITLNAFLHDSDFEGFEDYCNDLSDIGADAVIASDLGVVRRVKACSDLTVHLSTQASCLNIHAAKLWKQTGVKRLILGREVSIAEAGKIRKAVDIEVELFIHGAMCMAYSGNCTISNFTAGRDSNRGGCSHSCRFPYQLTPSPNIQQTQEKEQSIDPFTFMSSKDLMGVNQMAEFFEHGICSLKVEGRMKSSFYVASTSKAYRQTIDAYADGMPLEQALELARKGLEAIPHRDYFPGSLAQKAGIDSVYHQDILPDTGNYKYLGMVMDTTSDKIFVRTHQALAVGDTIELVPFHAAPFAYKVQQLFSPVGEPIEKARQDSIIALPRDQELRTIQQMNLIRTPKQTAAS